MPSIIFDKLISGGLITNYACPSKCAHCLYKCGPGRDKSYIDEDMAKEAFRIMRLSGIHSIHIGGGEPFLKHEKLPGILNAAFNEGIHVDYVETNASWYKDDDSACTILKNLNRVGLSTLLVSISPFHNAFIPFRKTKGVIRAADVSGVGVFPWITDFISNLAKMDDAEPHLFSEYQRRFGDNYLVSVLRRYWIHPGGRAINLLRQVLPKKSADLILKENRGGCMNELSNTTHFHIDLYGNYIPGLCAGLGVSIEDLPRSLKSEAYPIITCLYHQGAGGLFKYAETRYGYTPKEDGYVNKCDLCMDVRTHLVYNNYNESRELMPAAFYTSS